MTETYFKPMKTEDIVGIDHPDFDHIEEAKGTLEHVDRTGVFDFTTSIQIAQTHALISIAQSLEAFAFATQTDFTVNDLTDAVLNSIVPVNNEANARITNINYHPSNYKG